VQDVCSNDCSGDADCGSGCCYTLSSGHSVCAPAQLCASPPSVGPGAGVMSVDAGLQPPPTGALMPITTCNKPTLVGDDGKFLGVASSSKLATDGVCNEISAYSGPIGSDSIFNQVGTYGSEVSSKSAYNTITTTPPRLRCESGKLLNPVTKNRTLAGAIDPDVLCDTLAANGL